MVMKLPLQHDKQHGWFTCLDLFKYIKILSGNTVLGSHGVINASCKVANRS